MWSPTAKAVAPPTLAAEPAEANPPSLKLRRVTHLIRIHPRVNPWLSAKAGKIQEYLYGAHRQSHKNCNDQQIQNTVANHLIKSQKSYFLIPHHGSTII